VTRARTLLLHLVVAALAIATVAPLAWMVAASFMPKGSADVAPPPLWPAHPTWANYRELLLGHPVGPVLLDYRIAPAFANSLALALLATLLGTALTVPAGYAFAKLRFRGRERLFRLLLAAAVVPGQVAMLPLFLMLREAHLVNSYAGVLAPGLAGIAATLLVRQAALAIPDEMLDAARLDGAGEFAIFARIALPLLAPVAATVALLAFLASWSDFLWPLIMLTDRESYTLPVALAAITREHGGDTELMMAGAVVTTLPVLILFLALQRAYLRGILGGGIKE
jgi:multiple sugar transport system permease protein